MIDFYQICYQDEQEKECYPCAQIYRNRALTGYFENSIIQELVPKSSSRLIGVASWRLRKKRQDGWTPMLCGFAGKADDLSTEKILKQDADIMVLTPRSHTHKMLANAEMWHGGPQHAYAWQHAIKEMQKIIKVPVEVTTPIYENHFIARKEIYHDYITTCLNPVIEYMSDKDVFLSDSGYATKKAKTQPQEVERYRQETGRTDYPIAPFILERLFSIWIEGKQFKIVNV